MYLFNRVELKYLVDRTTRTALEKDLAVLMQRDRFGNSNGGYIVRSLYFDSYDYMAYHEKMAGMAVRHKVRVRAYGEEPKASDIIRLEVKSRYLSFIQKTTTNMSLCDYRHIERAIYQRLVPEHLVNGQPNPNNFFRIQKLYNMMPIILIQYRRQAYEKNELCRVRVNFDDELLSTRDLCLFGPLRGERSILDYGNSIFEIKVDGGLPFWLHTLISKYDLQNLALSKYCMAVRCSALMSAMAREEAL
jgi:hypothetical protein